MVTVPTFTKQQVFDLLQEAINRSLTASGKEPAILDWDTKPLLAIDDLDSQMGVEITLDLELAFGNGIDLGTNVLVDPDGVRPKARSVRETVNAILSTLRRP